MFAIGNERESLGAFPEPEAMTRADRTPTALVFYHHSPSAKSRRDGLWW